MRRVICSMLLSLSCKENKRRTWTVWHCSNILHIESYCGNREMPIAKPVPPVTLSLFPFLGFLKLFI